MIDPNTPIGMRVRPMNTNKPPNELIIGTIIEKHEASVLVRWDHGIDGEQSFNYLQIDESGKSGMTPKEHRDFFYGEDMTFVSTAYRDM